MEEKGSKGGKGEEEAEEERRLLGGMAVVDFDMLCSAVAMHTQRKWNNVGDGGEEEGRGLGLGEAEGFSGCGKVSSSWIASRTPPLARPSIRLLSMLQIRVEYEESGIWFFFCTGNFHLVLVLYALANTVAFVVTRRHYFLYLAVSFTLSVGAYMGFFRMQVRKKFNIKGSDSYLDDCFYHLICLCCTLSQKFQIWELLFSVGSKYNRDEQCPGRNLAWSW